MPPRAIRVLSAQASTSLAARSAAGFPVPPGAAEPGAPGTGQGNARDAAAYSVRGVVEDDRTLA